MFLNSTGPSDVCSLKVDSVTISLVVAEDEPNAPCMRKGFSAASTVYGIRAFANSLRCLRPSRLTSEPVSRIQVRIVPWILCSDEVVFSSELVG